MNNLLNLRSFFKFLSKNKSYTLIDIFGLSISLMFVILIATYTVQELSTDNFQKNSDTIYALASEKTFGTAYRLADRLIERYPEIDKTCVISTHIASVAVTYGDRQINTELLLADSTFFQLFSFELVQGDRQRVLEARTNAVISESFARKAFPDRDPIGQVVKLQDDLSVTITGVMKDIKNSIVPGRDMLIRMDNVKYFNPGMDSNEYNNAGSAVVFLQVKPGADIHLREQEVADYFREIFWIYQRGISEEVHFVPLKDIYFSPIDTYELINKGDWKFVMILMSVGIVILIFAIINYINLTVAQTGFRAKEMATRRLLGSSRWELFARLMLESTFLTFVSFLLGLFLAFLFVPYANDLLETKLDLPDMITPVVTGVSFLLILLIGFLSGLLPAVIISNAKPVDVVKGSFRQKTKMVFSKFFITFQNVITITLIAVSITMVAQINHLIHAPLGYDPINILNIGAFNLNKDQCISFADELKQLACVKNVSLAEGSPFDGGNNNTIVYEDRNLSLQFLMGDSEYMDMLGIKVLSENNLATNDGYYLTEQALREFNISADTPSITVSEWWTIPVAGVVNDLYIGNVTNYLRPMLIQIKKAEDFPYGVWNILIEVQGDHRVAFEQIKELYEARFYVDFPGEYMDAMLRESFAAERRTSRIVMVFTFIAILISLLGLYAMSTYFIQQRAREIAVRKVFGSTNQQILLKLVFAFLNYVLIAFLISIPIIWYFMKEWLSGYSYRIPMNPLIFMAAGLFCLTVSFIAVCYQSMMAAHSNPVEGVKSE